MNASSTYVAVYCVIRGRVQGVGFRYSLAKLARSLRLAGWTRNALDGTVEAHCEGQKENIEKLRVWLRTGPPLARIDSVDYREAEVNGFSNFSIR